MNMQLREILRALKKIMRSNVVLYFRHLETGKTASSQMCQSFNSKMFLTNQFLSFYSTFSFFLYLRDFLVDQNGALVLCVEVTENYLFDLSEKVNYNFLQLLSFVIQIKFFSFQNFIERLFRHTSRIKNCIHFWTVFIALITTNW